MAKNKKNTNRILIVLGIVLLLSFSGVAAEDNLGFEQWTGNTPIGWNTGSYTLTIQQAPAFTEGSYAVNFYMPSAFSISLNPPRFSRIYKNIDFTNVNEISFDLKADGVISGSATFGTDEFVVLIDDKIIYYKKDFNGYEQLIGVPISTSSLTGVHKLEFRREKYCEQCSFGGNPSSLYLDNVVLLGSRGDNGRSCIADVMQCPDGSYVQRDPDNNCQFRSCPGSEQTAEQTDEDSSKKNNYLMFGVVVLIILGGIYIYQKNYGKK